MSVLGCLDALAGPPLAVLVVAALLKLVAAVIAWVVLQARAGR